MLPGNGCPERALAYFPCGAFGRPKYCRDREPSRWSFKLCCKLCYKPFTKPKQR